MYSLRMRIAGALVVGSLLQACASATLIHSRPEGARIYIDGEPRGTTPYQYSDQKIVGSNTHIRLVMDGYQDTTASLQRNEEFNVGACIGGVFLLFPFLWIMNYRPEHTYELIPLQPRADKPLPPIPLRLAGNDE